MSKLRELKFAAILLAAISLTACISAKPIETQGTIDDRPLLFFVSEGSNTPAAGELKVYVDGLYMGEADKFLNAKTGLAIVPGTHIVEVRRNDVSIYSEKIYVGSGTNKTIPLIIK